MLCLHSKCIMRSCSDLNMSVNLLTEDMYLTWFGRSEFVWFLSEAILILQSYGICQMWNTNE